MTDTALHPSQTPAARTVSRWLFACAAAVLLMALIGAVTRLTESGLSIVEWKPVAGALPPLSDAAWQEQYDLYQQSPQGRTVNHGMEMADFKRIFFWEWLHRLGGRMIGLIYALPLAFFWRRLPRDTRPAFIGLLALGALQGGMGWFMVQSGLVDQPAVSHYRLAAHLLLAAVIYALLLRLALRFCHAPAADAPRLHRFCMAALGMVLITLTWGAFTAGLDGGMVYNTFPKMDDHWLPPELWQAKPFLQVVTADPAVVQFVHRMLALLTLAKVGMLWHRTRKSDAVARVKMLGDAAGVMVLLQVVLGISTLLTQVDIALATLHQGGAFVLLGLLVAYAYETRPSPQKDAA